MVESLYKMAEKKYGRNKQLDPKQEVLDKNGQAIVIVNQGKPERVFNENGQRVTAIQIQKEENRQVSLKLAEVVAKRRLRQKQLDLAKQREQQVKSRQTGKQADAIEQRLDLTNSL